MKPFYRGLLAGIVLKEKINDVCKFLLINGINAIHVINSMFKNKIKENENISKIDFIVKITDETLFEEIFHGKLQPGWKYFSNKKILKIELPEDILDFINTKIDTIKVSDLFELKEIEEEHLISLDVPLFESFGKIYLYFTYFIDSQKFINVYTPDMNISKSDFSMSYSNYDNILCASLKYKNKIEYISNYYKLFFNNGQTLTPEILIMNNDKLNIPIENCKLIIIKDKSIKEYSYNEIIN
jgi:hypothetical protein